MKKDQKSFTGFSFAEQTRCELLELRQPIPVNSKNPTHNDNTCAVRLAILKTCSKPNLHLCSPAVLVDKEVLQFVLKQLLYRRLRVHNEKGTNNIGVFNENKWG